MNARPKMNQRTAVVLICNQCLLGECRTWPCEREEAIHCGNELLDS